MTGPAGRRVVSEGVVVAEDGERVQLTGSRCKNCGEYFYPARELCTFCSRSDQEPWNFGPEGGLYSYTVLMDPPNLPPRVVGQVEFDGKVRVQGQILTDDFSSLSLDMPMEAVVRSSGTDAGGDERITFGFRPRR